MKCYGEMLMDRSAAARIECCGSPAAGVEAHAEVCPLEDHDDCDAPTCSCGDATECQCPCDECQRSRAAALAYEARGDGPDAEDYE